MQSAGGRTPRWLLLVHQIPPRPSNLRVRIWRRLQQVGAIALRNSVYILPSGPESREDFEWMRAEIVGMGGQASVMEADVVDTFTQNDVVEQFRGAREKDFEGLMTDAAATVRRWGTRRRSTRAQRQREARAYRERLTRIEAIDHFGAANARRAADVVRQIEAALSDPNRSASSATPRLSTTSFQRAMWVTRPRPGIDRMASAWFIRQHISPTARFSFAQNGTRLPRGHVPFDMPDVEFGHHGSRCTFETFMERFGIVEPAAKRLAQLVHDLDLKDSYYGVPETQAVGRLVEGLRDKFSADAQLLEHGIVMIDALYRSFARNQRGSRRNARALDIP